MGRTYQSITVGAPAERVWSTLRNFHDLAWAAQVITECRPVGTRAADQVGAKRVLNDAFHETLVGIDERDRSITYSIEDGPSPVSRVEVSDYIGVVRVRPITEDNGRSFVEWSSTWQGNDKAAAEFCHNIYAQLLRALRKHFG